MVQQSGRVLDRSRATGPSCDARAAAGHDGRGHRRASDSFGWTALLLASSSGHKAAMNGYSLITRQLVATGRVHVDQPDQFGSTSLWWASLCGHVEDVRPRV